MLKENVHFSSELEAAIIGACLLEKTAFGRIYGIVDKDVFYFEGNKTVFSKLSEMWYNNRPIDMVTVTIELCQSGIEKITHYNTPYYVTKLTNSVVSTAHLEYHGLVLRQMYIEREMVKITSSGVAQGVDSMVYMEELQDKMIKLRQVKASDDFKGMDELLIDLMKHMDVVKDKELAGITTGFPTLNKLTGGLMGGGMYIVAARPSVGKSAFMGKMILNAAREGHRVAVISLEMEDKQITARISSLVTEIEFWRIYRSRMVDVQQQEYFYQKVNDELAMLPIKISDSVNVNIGDIKAKIARLKQKKEVDILFIDYLQLIDSDGMGRNMNREQEVSRISRGVKLAAKEFDIPIVVLCQLNRLSESTSDKRPKLHNLRESGSLEQDADGVIFLHRDFMSGIKEGENGFTTENEADIIIAKWRDGEVTEYKIGFNGQRMKFYELDEKQESANFKPYSDDNPF